MITARRVVWILAALSVLGAAANNGIWIYYMTAVHGDCISLATDYTRGMLERIEEMETRIRILERR